MLELEIKELLAPCAAIFALLFAAFAFLLPQALRAYDKTRTMLSKAEVPDGIRSDWRFMIGVHGHSMLLTLTSLLSLFLGATYCALLYRITQYYLGSQAYSANAILTDFSRLTFCVGILVCIIIAAAIAMMVHDVFISERYPTLLKAYIKKVLDVRPKDKEVRILLSQARTLFNQGKFSESILYGAMALEYAITSKLDVPPQSGWVSLVNTINQKMGPSDAEKLRSIGVIRNKAAHPTPDTSVTDTEAKEVLEISSGLIKRLEQAI